MEKRAIVIGGSSGIGRALVRELHAQGYRVGVGARRYPLLEDLRSQLSEDLAIQQVDVADRNTALQALDRLVAELGGLDIIIVAAGVGGEHGGMQWENQQHIIDVNVSGLTAILNWAYHYFSERGRGHIVAISSVLAVRGNRHSPAYSASKAFASHYLQGLRQRVHREKKPMLITDIRPGFVDTEMVQGRKDMFWVTSPEKAAKLIFHAVQKQKSCAYITGRWRLVAWLMRLLPERLYKRL